MNIRHGSKKASRPTISSYLAARVVDATSARGIDVTPILEQAKITLRELRDPDARIDGERYLLLWSLAAASAEEPGFSITVALCGSERREPDNLLRLICMSSPTVGEALARTSRYLRLATELSSWKMDTVPSPALRIVRNGPSDAGWWLSDEFAVAEVVRLARLLTATEWSPVAIHFTHPAPSDLSRYETFFQAPVRFSSQRTEILVSQELLNVPIVSGDQSMIDFFDSLASKLLATRTNSASARVSEKLEDLVLTQVHDIAPPMSHFASQLGMSTRTLRRHLEAEKTTYKAVFDRARFAMAQRYLERGETSLAQIAFLLGFSDSTAFHRAFRRWAGMTPLAYQERFRLREEA